MDVLVLLALVLVGLLVGFTAGLVGIGGGVLIVPFLYFFYAHPGWSGVATPAALHTTIAHATSLFIIIPTAIWGARSYHKAGLVVWRAAVPIALMSMVFAILGVRLQLILPGPVVRVGFGTFLLITGLQLLWRPHANQNAVIRVTWPAVLIIGIAVGILSGLMGIGGGAIAAALMIYMIGLTLKQAAATSLAIVGLTAIVGALTYVIKGWGLPGLPSGSIGYIHASSALPIMIGSVVSVQWGTRVNQRMDVRTLRRVFSAFFMLLGVYLIATNVSAL